MQSEIFQALICYNFDDYSSQFMETLRKLEHCEKIQYCRLEVSNSNQLINPKHLQRVPEPLNGLSVWFSGIHNQGEDCWLDSCAENHHWHPPQGKTSKGKGKSSRYDHSLETIVRKRPFKSVGELHKEWTEAGVTASKATTHTRILDMGFKQQTPAPAPEQQTTSEVSYLD